MCDHILYDPARPRKIVNSATPDASFSPVQAELICPRCYREAGFSAVESHVWCPTCGWIHALTTEEYDTLVDAISGITDLNTQVYLQILAAQDALALRACPILLPQGADAGPQPIAPTRNASQDTSAA